MKKPDGVDGSYNNFINSPAGMDFIKHCEALTQQYISAAMNTFDSKEKAYHVDRAAGVALIRDYILRRSGVASVGTSGTSRSDSGTLTLDKK